MPDTTPDKLMRLKMKNFVRCGWNSSQTHGLFVSSRRSDWCEWSNATRLIDLIESDTERNPNLNTLYMDFGLQLQIFLDSHNDHVRLKA